MQSSPVESAAAWQAAANAQDVGALLELSDANIEVAGPRGSGFGHQLLREWMGRAGLMLSTLRVFARGEMVVFEQRGVWRSQETGEVTGERALASVFEVRQGRVVKVARFDELDVALRVAGLDRSDEVPRTTGGEVR